MSDDGGAGNSDDGASDHSLGDATLIPLVLAAASNGGSDHQVTLVPVPSASRAASLDPSAVDSKCSTDLSPGSNARRPSKVPLERRQSELDFKRRLEMILSMEEGAAIIARKLYSRIEGETDRIPEILHFLDVTWGFPDRLFPLLWTQLRRAVFRHRGAQQQLDNSSGEAPAHVGESEWVEAFTRWLHSVRTRCGAAQLSRRGLVRMRQSKNREVKETYFQGPKLGEGAYGEVHVMFHKGLGVERAVKTIHKDQLSMAARNAEVEVNVLTSLDHPHIVRIYETFQVDDILHIVMDYAEGGDLASVIDRARSQQITLAEPWVCTAAHQICAALAYMHSKGVIHCDLKPANGMLLKPCNPDRGEVPHVVLVDFGISEICLEANVGGPMKVRGTPLYLAPEAFEGDLTEKSDVWALGVIIYEMLAGERPFQADNVVVLLSKVATVEPPLAKFPPLAQEVLKGVLVKDPIARFTAKECRNLEWFAQESQQSHAAGASCGLGQIDSISHVSFFHRAAMFCIAADLSMKQMSDLYDIFKMMDTDGAGHLTYDQFAEGLKKLGSTKDPADLLAILDSDQSGLISYTEFLAGMLGTRHDVSEQSLREAFSVFDLDGDGLISMHELRVMLSCGGPLVEVLPDGQTVDDVMEEVGRGEGFVSFRNFVEYVRKAATAPPATPSNADVTTPKSRKGVVLDEMLSDLGTAERRGRPPSTPQFPPPVSRRLLRKKTDVLPVKDPLPPFHSWISTVRGELQNVSSIQRVLSFSGKPIEPPLRAKSRENLQKHFAACAAAAELLARGDKPNYDVLREAVQRALVSEDALLRPRKGLRLGSKGHSASSSHTPRSVRTDLPVARERRASSAVRSQSPVGEHRDVPHARLRCLSSAADSDSPDGDRNVFHARERRVTGAANKHSPASDHKDGFAARDRRAPPAHREARGTPGHDHRDTSSARGGHRVADRRAHESKVARDAHGNAVNAAMVVDRRSERDGRRTPLPRIRSEAAVPTIHVRQADRDKPDAESRGDAMERRVVLPRLGTDARRRSHVNRYTGRQREFPAHPEMPNRDTGTLRWRP